MTAGSRAWPPTAAGLRATFDGAAPHLVGIEDEVMLLAPSTLELAPLATEVLALLGGDSRFKLELPASQLEIVTPSASRVADVTTALLEARRALAARVDGFVRLASAGVHPFSPGSGELNRIPRYESTIADFGPIAHRQLVCALQVHVSVGDADRALAVYNAARSYLPLLAALAANSPFYEGVDTGLASVRPMIGQLLPRQGVPPAIASWDDYADVLEWGSSTGTFVTAQTWWWELRPHVSFGTLEFRVPDAQSSVADAAAIAAVTQALVVWLGERYERGERLRVADTWQIAENRWSACRHGVEGEMAELCAEGGRRRTREFLSELLAQLSDMASRLGTRHELAHAQAMVEVNGAIAQREAAERGGSQAAAAWLSEQFLAEPAWLRSAEHPAVSP